MKYYDSATSKWVELDAKNADTIGGKSASAFANASHTHTASDLPNASTSAKGIVQLSSSTSSTSTTLASTASAVKSAYDKAVSAETIANENSNQIGLLSDDLDSHISNFMPHDSELNQYVSGKDANGGYTIVEFKRTDGTLYMKSTLSNADTNGNYQTATWNFYNDNGTLIVLTKTWNITYDENGIATTKVVS